MLRVGRVESERAGACNDMSDMRDELKVTEEDVFGNLRPEVKQLSDCIRAWEKREVPGARAAFVDYFMYREKPLWTFD